MKKGNIYQGEVVKVLFPGKGIVKVEDEDNPVCVKDVIPGQKVSFRLTKRKNDKYEGTLISVDEKALNEIESSCIHFEKCGGCSYRNLRYEDQLALKEQQIREIFAPVIDNFEDIFEGIKGSPVENEYRNKMEFSFGDACKGGSLELGLHKKGSFYDILSVKQCQIVDADYRAILNETLAYFRGLECSYFHKITHEGFLRHLLVRKAARTGEIMICLVTSSSIPMDTPCCEKGIVEDWLERIMSIKYVGKLAGVLHIINDSEADMVKSDETKVIFGRDYINEEVLGLKFKISPFSFFQTNTLSAEVIYSVARDYVKNAGGAKPNGILFDLYSGTGTIAQLMAPVVSKVIGVEIVEEAVIAARENAQLNGLANCEFIADDVLKALDNISEKPDCIILDPPRDGVNPKALRKIIDYGVDNILYISCKPTSLARDLEIFKFHGYYPTRMCAVDQFPGTVHVETVCLLSKLHEAKHHINVKVDMDELDLTSAEAKATYKEIEEWVQEHYGFHVTNLNIAQVKQKHGIIERENYNKPKSENSRQPGCPEEKVKAIEEALKFFQMI